MSLHSFSCFEILVTRLLTFALFVYYCICGTVDTWFISFMAGRNLLDICFLRSIYFSALDWHALFVQTPFTVEYHKIYQQSCILISILHKGTIYLDFLGAFNAVEEKIKLHLKFVFMAQKLNAQATPCLIKITIGFHIHHMV